MTYLHLVDYGKGFKYKTPEGSWIKVEGTSIRDAAVELVKTHYSDKTVVGVNSTWNSLTIWFA